MSLFVSNSKGNHNPRAASSHATSVLRRLHLLCFFAGAALCFTTSALAKSNPPPPVATLKSGLSISGSTDQTHGVAYWEGIRYAQPPTGNYRWAPPQAIDDDTQKVPAAPSKNESPKKKKKKKHAGENAAISLRPPIRVDDIIRSGSRFLNASVDWMHTIRNVSSSIEYPKPLFFQRRADTETITATQPGPRCPQQGHLDEQDEDCLYLNIYRPTDTTRDPLPVIMFIHGGGWQGGAGSDYDPTSIVQTSEKSGLPVMVVTINYRLALLGFAASSDIAALANIEPVGCADPQSKCTSRDAGAESAGLNLGYHDMKMALNWTYTNIQGFGGDPGKITIMGQSAGAFGVSALLLGHQGSAVGADQNPYADNPPRPPFQGAIMMSGSPSGPAMPRPIDRDDFWNEMLVSTNCADPSLGTPAARIDCARKAKWQDLLTISLRQRNETDWNLQRERFALGAYPWTPTLDGGAAIGGFFGQAPSVIQGQGDFAKVPIITGDVEDEGTLFAPHDFDDFAIGNKWLQGIYFANTTFNASDRDEIQALLDKEYPDNPVVGSPYTPLNGNKLDRFFPGLDNQYKRLSSLYGDLRFQAGRRLLLDTGLTTKTTPAAYSYAFLDPSPREPISMGVPHSTDLDVYFGNIKSPLTSVMVRQFSAFATNLSPTGNNLPEWPVYDHGNPGRVILAYKDGATGMALDTYRADGMDLINSPRVRQLFNS
ncbi:unnamed protein product [Sympodiomycopsis kandeliae]